MATFYNPVRLFFGPQSLLRLRQILEDFALGGEILLLTGSRSLQESGMLDVVLAQLSGLPYRHLSGVPPTPDVADIARLGRNVSLSTATTILAVGGGSVIDTAKALAALSGRAVETTEEVREIVTAGGCLAAEAGLPRLVAVPTTAGTGSEVTSWATVWDREVGAKYSLEDPRLYPVAAIVDPYLTLSQDEQLTAATALDALSHATEAYWAKKSNAIVRLYALQAVKLITDNLLPLLEDLESRKLRAKLAQASLFAGLAFSNTKTTACHAVSYPLTIMFGISHGIAASLTLGRMLAKNMGAFAEPEALLAAYGAAAPGEVTAWIEEVYAKANVPGRLGEYGVTPADLDKIVERSYTPGRMDNNPVAVDKAFLKSLLAEIL